MARNRDEFGKFKRVDHAGCVYQGTPYSVEPDATAKHIFVASMMHTSMRSHKLFDHLGSCIAELGAADATCPTDQARSKEASLEITQPDLGCSDGA